MYTKHLFLYLLIAPFYLSGMDCFVSRTFNNEPLTPLEQKNLLAHLIACPLTLDDKGNTVLHAAAVVYEWPDAINELILARPELADYMNTPNNKGITPADLLHIRQNRTSTPAPSRVLTPSPLKKITLSPEQIRQLDISIDHKLVLAEQGRPHEPFTDFEKGRILRIFSAHNSPLHLAAQLPQYPDLVNHLIITLPHLKHSINTRNQDGRTPLEIAIQKNNLGAEVFLRRLGAKHTS